MEFEPMLTPRENVPRRGSNPRRCGQRAQALPTELFRPRALPDSPPVSGVANSVGSFKLIRVTGPVVELRRRVELE